MLVLPTVCSAFAVRLTEETWIVLAFWWLRSERTSPDAPPVVPAAAPLAIELALAVKELGGVMPRLSSLLRAISSTSTSIRTSGSGTSIEATNFSAMRTASGVSRITTTLVRSSMNKVLAPSMDFSMLSTSLGTAFVR